MRGKTLKKFSILAFVSLSLSGCLNNLALEQNDEDSEDGLTAQVTANQLSNNYYRSVILDGQYRLGASASSDSDISSAANQKAFEDGLLRITQSVFPTDQYFLQEGQVIDSQTMARWLARESATNPEGLNPALTAEDQRAMEEGIEEETSEETSQEEPQYDAEGNEITTVERRTNNEPATLVEAATPIYLSQVMEKNIMVETEEGYALSGIAIGLAMNSSYQYTDSNGVVYEQEISIGEMRERGRQYANIIVGRIRNTEELRSVPIVVGLYRMSGESSITGGSYVLDGISREGNSVTDWEEINEYYVALPATDTDTFSEQYLFFDNFKAGVENFFPNLNGIFGTALYVDNNLAELNIEIVTQFYRRTEIVALTQHVSDMLQQYLPQTVPIEVKILSDVGVEAYVGYQPEQDRIQSHVFY